MVCLHCLTVLLLLLLLLVLVLPVSADAAAGVYGSPRLRRGERPVTLVPHQDVPDAALRGTYTLSVKITAPLFLVCKASDHQCNSEVGGGGGPPGHFSLPRPILEC